jgi:hypothetical protein
VRDLRLLAGWGQALELAVEGEAGAGPGDSAEESGGQADGEAGGVALAERGYEHAGGGGPGEGQREGEQGAAAANYDRGDDPGEQPDNTPAEEKEEHEGETRFPDHEDSVRRISAGVKRQARLVSGLWLDDGWREAHAVVRNM